MSVPYFDAAVIARVTPAAAVDAIRRALAAGLDPALDPPRSSVPLANGEFLLMASESAAFAGVKIVAVAPGNPARGLARINALYALFDAETLRPAALLDGAALTALRTPAVSIAAALPFLAGLGHPLRVVVFGAGPQGLGHRSALAAVCDLERVDVVVRAPDRVRLPPCAVPGDVLRAGSSAALHALARADVVVTATSAREPVFDSALLAPHAVVLAVGVHEPDARELDEAVIGRATVIVEDPATALREAGDVALAVRAGALRPEALVPMRRFATETNTRAPGQVVVKTVGMSWEDRVVAEAVVAEAEL